MNTIGVVATATLACRCHAGLEAACTALLYDTSSCYAPGCWAGLFHPYLEIGRKYIIKHSLQREFRSAAVQTCQYFAHDTFEHTAALALKLNCIYRVYRSSGFAFRFFVLRYQKCFLILLLLTCSVSPVFQNRSSVCWSG